MRRQAATYAGNFHAFAEFPFFVSPLSCGGLQIVRGDCSSLPKGERKWQREYRKIYHRDNQWKKTSTNLCMS
jgi:hypothetical protein